MSFFTIALLVLLPPFFFGLTNLLDNRLTRYEGLRKTHVLVFLFAMTGLLFAPVMFLIAPVTWPPLQMLPLLLLIGAIEVFYFFPYLKAYNHLDTSIVAALFALARIFTPLLAFIMINEAFAAKQYLGFFIVIIASVILSLDRRARFKLNIGFWLMLLASGLTVFENVVTKRVTFDMNWASLFFWSLIFSAMAALLILLKRDNRRDIANSLRWASLKQYAPWLLLTDIFQFMGRISFIFALSLVPVTFTETGLSFQPVLVLATSYILFKLFRFKIWEQQTSVLRKLICFLFMIVGAILLI